MKQPDDPTPLLPCCPENGKVCFSKKEAQTVRNRRWQSNRRRHKTKLRIYYCGDCGWWHLTHHTR